MRPCPPAFDDSHFSADPVESRESTGKRQVNLFKVMVKIGSLKPPTMAELGESRT